MSFHIHAMLLMATFIGISNSESPPREPECWKMETNQALYGYNNKILRSVSVDDCKVACKREYEFYCISFDYLPEERECYLSSEAAATYPEMFGEHTASNYYQRVWCDYQEYGEYGEEESGEDGGESGEGSAESGDGHGSGGGQGAAGGQYTWNGEEWVWTVPNSRYERGTGAWDDMELELDGTV